MGCYVTFNALRIYWLIAWDPWVEGDPPFDGFDVVACLNLFRFLCSGCCMVVVLSLRLLLYCSTR